MAFFYKDELLRLIHTAPEVNEKNYENELRRKQSIVKLFKEYQKKFEKIKKLYDDYINEFNDKITLSYSNSLCDLTIPIYDLTEGTISKEGAMYYCKINGMLLRGNIGNVYPSHENYKIKKCKYDSIKLCTRSDCPFYHEEEQRNFKERQWYKMIKNKKTLPDELLLFKHKTSKEKKEIIEEHKSFVMHNLLILLLLVENE